MSINPRLRSLLENLNRSLDINRQRQLEARYRQALDWHSPGPCPLAVSFPFPMDHPLQPFPHREVFDDPGKMLFNELVHSFDMSAVLSAAWGADVPMTVRANFGTVLISSMFGARVEQHEDNPPWVRHDVQDHVSLKQICETDSSAMNLGWIPRVAQRMQDYHELLEPFEPLREWITITLPDLQGPFDNLELIHGSDAFMQLIEAPEMTDAALGTLAQAQINLFKHLSKWTSERHPGYCHQHGVMLKGNILIRNDSCVMMSGPMYQQQVAPHDQAVLEACGGGAVHSCGNVGHLVPHYLRLPGLRSLDLGQSELNDMAWLYEQATQQQVPLIRVAVTADQITSGQARQMYPTGAVLIFRGRDDPEAQQMVQAYRQSIESDPSNRSSQ